MPDVSTWALNNAVTLTALGLCVFQTPPDETRDAVTAALEAGYRDIDTAAAYGNERQSARRSPRPGARQLQHRRVVGTYLGPGMRTATNPHDRGDQRLRRCDPYHPLTWSTSSSG
jgi:aryl-alcohol dehydrogenase-like predicted oxidoreductase